VSDNKLDFVGFQETKKESFSYSFLNYIHKDFTWKALPTVGTAGGILVGVNTNKFEVLSWQIGSYSLAAMIKNDSDKFVWRLVVVYGSPYEEGKLEFLQELEGLLDNWEGPTIFCGDFNIVSNIKEKSNGNINQKWADFV